MIYTSHDLEIFEISPYKTKKGELPVVHILEHP